jgi:hypothetical protein
MITWQIGRRDSETGIPFVRDLASRLGQRIQLTTDAFAAYRPLVGDAFHGDVDYAMLVKYSAIQVARLAGTARAISVARSIK